MSFEDDMKLINAAREERNAIALPDEPGRGIAMSDGSVVSARSISQQMEEDRQRQWLIAAPCSKEIN
jgi:hypothetical protein